MSINEASCVVYYPHLHLLEVTQSNLGQCRRSGDQLIVDFVEPDIRPGRVIAATHLERNLPIFGQLIHPLRLVGAVETVAEQVPAVDERDRHALRSCVERRSTCRPASAPIMARSQRWSDGPIALVPLVQPAAPEPVWHLTITPSRSPCPCRLGPAVQARLSGYPAPSKHRSSIITRVTRRGTPRESRQSALLAQRPRRLSSARRTQRKRRRRTLSQPPREQHIMLHVHNITIRYGGQEVLNEVTFFVGPKERVGLVGDNGAGKTTLLEIIAGRRSADDGFVKLDPHNTLGYLSQESQCRLGITLEEEMLSAFPGVLAARAELARLQDEMDAVAASGDLDAIDRLVEAMAETQDEYDRLDGYTVDARVGEVLHGLGFAQDDRPRLTDEFSGGWQMRIALAKLLVSQPPLLLLDEPTNHIDKAARDWLDGYLDGYRGSLIVVSHDTALLDNVAKRIIELEDNVATS